MESKWTLDIKNQAWTEDTENQVEFLIRTMGLTGRERVLDLACGYGRHSLALARRGFSVVGVDFTPAYIADGRRQAAKEGLEVEFLLADVREIEFREVFDVVLNLADGAIGYFLQEQDNLRLFDVISTALKPGGKHFMDVCNGAHAAAYFPKRHWMAGEKGLSLAEFSWEPDTRRMRYAGYQLPYGKPLGRPQLPCGDPIRLYTLEEVKTIYAQREMEVRSAYSDYNGAPASSRQLQLMIYGQKRSPKEALS
jgi:SAM-dependent methyltransferase